MDFWAARSPGPSIAFLLGLPQQVYQSANIEGNTVPPYPLKVKSKNARCHCERTQRWSASNIYTMPTQKKNKVHNALHVHKSFSKQPREHAKLSDSISSADGAGLSHNCATCGKSSTFCFGSFCKASSARLEPHRPSLSTARQTTLQTEKSFQIFQTLARRALRSI